LFYLNVIYAQSFRKEISSSIYKITYEEKLTLPKVDIHIAAGISPGARIGLRYLFLNNYSFEIAYGNDLLNFITLSDFQRRYSLGVNFHLSKSKAALSFLSTYVEQPQSVYKALFFSPTFGLIPIRESGFNMFFRFGIHFKFIKNFPSGKWEYEDIGPNLDVGISWIF
jgi:hypothetical protein